MTGGGTREADDDAGVVNGGTKEADYSARVAKEQATIYLIKLPIALARRWGASVSNSR